MRIARLIFLTIFAVAFLMIHVENVSAEAIENDAVEESIIEEVTVNTEVEIAVLPNRAYHEWLFGCEKD